jgi:CRP/FNR family transcriptional regulator, cyclic AMP receptor protein
MRNILKSHPIFAGLEEEDLQQLESSLNRRRYRSGQIVFHMGDEGGNLFIIHSGRVKVFIPSREGDELILAILGDGEILGELSFIDAKSRSATVETLEETEVYILRRQDFLALMKEKFNVVQHVLEILSQRLRDTDMMLAECHFLDVNARLAKKIWDMGSNFGIKEERGIRIGVRVTQKDLAAMIGATRESVNKQLRRFREKGIIDLPEGYIKILDPLTLARIARINLKSRGRADF